MSPTRWFAGSLLGIVLLGLGWLFDRSLVERQMDAEAAAVAVARETAHLGAMTLRAAIARTELALVAKVPPESVRVATLFAPAARRISSGPAVPYEARSSSELIELLTSDQLSPSGIPEPVVAALALERRGAPNADRRVADVAAKLLGGELPASPCDVPELAQRLGLDAGADPRVTDLVQDLDEAPRFKNLPAFPDFRRSLEGRRLDGWSMHGLRLVRYSVAVDDLLRDASLPEPARVAGSSDVDDTHAFADVPDVPGLIVAVDPATPDRASVRLLRVGLWIVLFVTAGALLAYQRALGREARAIGRERQFLSNVTHELKTPLAALRILGESLARRRGDPVEYGALVSQETTRLQLLVDGVLTATRLDEAPSLSRVRPSTIAERVVSLLSGSAKSRSVELRAELDPGDVPEAFWDGDAVHRALINLVENAIEHGGAGGTCTLRMEVLSDAIRYVVADRGPGIRQRDRTRVFERFFRGDMESTGTGLGLHVVERVAEAHGGRIDLETAPGEGCRFSLTLPIVPGAVGRV